MTKPQPLHLALGAPARETPAVSMEQYLRRVDAPKPPAWLAPAGSASQRKATPMPVAPPSGPSREDLERVMEEARKAGEEAGLNAAKAQVDAVIEKYLAAIEALAETRASLAKSELSDIVSVALVIAKAIVARELKTDPAAVLAAVDEATGAFTREEPLRLRVGTSELALIRERRPELLRTNVDLIEDPALDLGGCIAENARRVVDATLKTRLVEIEAALHESFSRGDK